MIHNMHDLQCLNACITPGCYKVPHAIDAMHVQKNVFESLMGTLIDTAKSKDGLKARKDLVQLKVMQNCTRYLRIMENTLCPWLATT